MKRKVVQTKLEWNTAQLGTAPLPENNDGFIEIIDDEMPPEILEFTNNLLYAWWLSQSDEQLREWTVKGMQEAQRRIESVIRIAENEIKEGCA